MKVSAVPCLITKWHFTLPTLSFVWHSVTLQVSYLNVGNTLVYAWTHYCALLLQYKEVLNISTVHQPRRLQRHTLPVLSLSKKRLSTVSYQASSSSSICFLLDGRYISRLSTFYFQGGILTNFLSFSFYPFFFSPHGCRRYMLCFIFTLVQISISFVSKVFLTLSNLIHKNQQMSVAPLLWWMTIWSLSTNF